MAAFDSLAFDTDAFDINAFDFGDVTTSASGASRLRAFEAGRGTFDTRVAEYEELEVAELLALLGRLMRDGILK